MRPIIRFPMTLVLTCVFFGLAAELKAQPATRPGQRPPQQPAANKPLTQKAAPKDQADDPDTEQEAKLAREKHEKMLARLDKVLLYWERESAKIKSLHGKQSRSEFNHSFAVETVSEGPFFLETPDKGRIDLKPIVIKKGAVSNKKTADNPPVPYKLETGKPERWICTGAAILVINDDEKTYKKEVIPDEQRGKNIVESPLPFLFGMKAEDAKNRFKLSIFKETDETVTLLAIPKMAKDQENYQKAAITLNKKTFVPTEVRLLDQSKLEIVYTFHDVVVNDSDVKSKLKSYFPFAEKDPFLPSLKGFEPFVPTEQPIQPASNRGSADRDLPRTAQGVSPTNPDQSPPPGNRPQTGKRPAGSNPSSK